MTDEQTVHLNPGTGTPGQVIRNLYFNGRLAYRMGFPEFAYPSLFIVGDQIGSSRTTVGLLGGTGSSGPTNFVTAGTEFYPFGAYVAAPATNLEQEFTGKIRDVETGNDYFGARYYSSSTGRFMSPDWSAQEEPVPYGELDDPQSLNLYVYVRDNPLSRTDNYGHSPWGFAGGFEGCDGSNSCQRNLQEQWSSQAAANAQAAAVQQQTTSSTANANANAAAEGHQYDLVVERTNKLLGTDDAADHIDPNGTLHGGNYAFGINGNDKSDAAFKSSLNKALGEADGSAGAHGGLTPPTHRVGFSTSLHHDNNALHVDHFNGAKFPIGTLLHAIVDVGVGSAFYGSTRAFSYAGVQ
ncbi:MAG TPA: RHS repeat-associated core domain-containing protein [Acidisarcina sp.]